MSDNTIHHHREITGLVPIAHHDHENDRKRRRRKKREHDQEQQHSDIPEQAVEDLLHHEDGEPQTTESTQLPTLPEEEQGQDHLDLLL